MCDAQVADFTTHLLRHPRCGLQTGIGEDEGKLLATVTRHQVSRTVRAGLEHVCNAPQAGVSRLVSVKLKDAAA